MTPGGSEIRWGMVVVILDEVDAGGPVVEEVFVW